MSNVLIDFDGVIHDYKHPVEGKKMGKPIEGAGQALARFRDQRKKVIIFSSNNKQVIADWMDYYGLYYDEIVYKPHAEVYIDDHALKFTNWNEVWRMMNQ